MTEGETSERKKFVIEARPDAPSAVGRIEAPDVPELADVPDCADFENAQDPACTQRNIEAARARASRQAEESIARKKVAGAVVVGGSAAGMAGYGLAKSGLWAPAGIFLGKYVVGPYAAWKSMPVVDWFANKMNKWGDKLIQKNFFLIGPLAVTLGGVMDWAKMKIAPEKSLAEFIKKDHVERKKLAEKELKRLRDEEKKLYKKQDEAAKKKSRRAVITKRYGVEVADALLDEIDSIEKEEATKTEPVEPAKAA